MPSPRFVLATLAVVGFATSALSQAPAVLHSTEKYLFVVRGDWLYQFDVDTLKLRNKARLDGGGGGAIGQLVRDDAFVSVAAVDQVGDGAADSDDDPQVIRVATNEAVERGLKWLVDHQDKDGNWNNCWTSELIIICLR